MTGKYLLLALLATAAFAQDPVSITPYQLIDARAGNAIACSNCSIYTYAAGTNTPLATYTSSTLATPNTNPVLTNSAGYAVNGATVTGIWVGSSCYKFVAKDSSAVTLFTQDNICDRGAVLKALLAGSGGAALVGYKLSATSSTATTVAAKLNSFYECVADFGATNGTTSTVSTDSTAAIQACVTAATAVRTTAHLLGGFYKVTGGLNFTSYAALQGEGPTQSVLVQASNAASGLNVTGVSVMMRDFGYVKASGVTGGTGLNLDPDPTSAVGAKYGIYQNIGIASLFCIFSDAACVATGNGQRLDYGVLIQSGVADSYFNRFDNLDVMWATSGVAHISGGLVGNTGPGATFANTYTSPNIDSTVQAFLFGASSETYVTNGTCTNASNAVFRLTAGNGATWAAQASNYNWMQCSGEYSTGDVDMAVNGVANTIVMQGAIESLSVRVA